MQRVTTTAAAAMGMTAIGRDLSPKKCTIFKIPTTLTVQTASGWLIDWLIQDHIETRRPAVWIVYSCFDSLELMHPNDGCQIVVQFRWKVLNRLLGGILRDVLWLATFDSWSIKKLIDQLSNGINQMLDGWIALIPTRNWVQFWSSKCLLNDRRVSHLTVDR